MQEQHFDDFAKDIGSSAGSRRRALQVVGAALASAGLLPLVSREASAGRAEKRCKNKGGVFLSEGECHCGITQQGNFQLPSCNGDADCRCVQTAGGRGFCARYLGFVTGVDCICNGCPANQVCMVLPGTDNGGRECITTKECVTVVGSGYGCVNGRCELTGCIEPCPTQP